MDLPPSNESYKDMNYWNERYKTEEKYDWFKTYKDFVHLLEEHVKKSDRILMLGCGNSCLSEQMFNDGFKHIVNVDFSDIVLKKMRLKLPSMEWLTMDIKHLAFIAGSFDVVIEKGTLDALLVEEDVWHISEEGAEMMSQIVENVRHVLTPSGKFLSITFAQPHFRMPLIRKEFWDVKYETFGDGFHYFFYVAKMKQEADEDR
ncbi:EEF1A lysine methyltransferase 4-like [Neocloeon triangulifer]|uniref:EEF1A lysine methyltransferase 4-like n=1 Tax=Neocloeon triangulifer TaxID=2078957 RepID=UPI00286F3040|nr:EEF1A lysine methyltransferase 4-like [Neocloeon triangulifer]